MDELTRDKRRIWLLISGTHPYADLQGRTEGWLDDNLFKVQETTYFSHSSLKSALYLPEVPVYESLPDSLHNRVDAVLGDTIRLAGIELGAPATPDLALPVTLYWEAVTPTDRRYKYALRLTEIRDDGATETLSVSEREPYDGAIPTIYWDPGKIIVEYSELPPAPWPQPPDGADAEAFWARYRLTLQVYDAETLEPLPVTQAGAAETAEDGHTLILPAAPAKAVSEEPRPCFFHHGAARTAKAFWRGDFAEKRMPYLSLDVLKMGLRGVPEFAIDPDVGTLSSREAVAARAMSMSLLDGVTTSSKASCCPACGRLERLSGAGQGVLSRLHGH